MNARHAQAIKKFLEARDAQKAQNSRVYNYYSTADTDIEEAVTYSLNCAKAYLNFFPRKALMSTGRISLKSARGRISAPCSC